MSPGSLRTDNPFTPPGILNSTVWLDLNGWFGRYIDWTGTETVFAAFPKW